MIEISAYIPCRNNAGTLKQAIESVLAQTHPVSELFVVDDGSQDESAKVGESLSVKVIPCSLGRGRGAARATAMSSARNELVLCVDASKALPAGFVRDALNWFEDERVAAVCGRIVQPPAVNTAGRWCGRHLLKVNLKQQVSREATFISAGAIVRKSAVIEVGNYDASLTFAEDRDLGTRLFSAGYSVVFDPGLCVTSNTDNELWKVLERYWRWHAPVDGKIDWHAYLKQIAYSVKVMSVEDLRAGDVFSVPISLLSPHYQLWRSLVSPRQ